MSQTRYLHNMDYDYDEYVERNDGYEDSDGVGSGYHSRYQEKFSNNGSGKSNIFGPDETTEL